MLDYDPYLALDRLKPMRPFKLTSTDVQHGSPLARPQWSASAGGEDRSPQLSWSGFPALTRSFAVTCFDPDAPSASGWWHWAVANLPPTVTSLETDAGPEDGANLPADALVLPNERGEHRYIGAAPTPGTGVHRYMFVVHALDVIQLDLARDATPANLGSQCFFHGLGRAILVGTAERS